MPKALAAKQAITDLGNMAPPPSRRVYWKMGRASPLSTGRDACFIVNAVPQEVGRVKVMVELARRENLSIRQLYQRVIGQRAHRVVIGTPVDIADGLEQWFTAGAADGFNILPLTFPGGLRDFVDLFVPELQWRGLFRADYEGRTLRENLGLPRPVNRWSDAAAAELRRVS